MDLHKDAGAEEASAVPLSGAEAPLPLRNSNSLALAWGFSFVIVGTKGPPCTTSNYPVAISHFALGVRRAHVTQEP